MLKRHSRRGKSPIKRQLGGRVWASVGMRLTFRAEVMPGRERELRTFTVARVLPNGRVELSGMFGQHAEAEFEAVR
ncbi:MAG: hypothetical protein JOZ52_05020 [Acidobacteria bacterium]|nr:hypothetical protein [Acidobacteriota bacterium]